MRIRLGICLLAACLFLPTMARADEFLYSYTSSSDGFSWSFEVPSLITSSVTITSFLSSSVNPTGGFGSFGCDTITSVQLLQPEIAGDNALVTSSSACAGEIAQFTPAIDTIGSFTPTGIVGTLTIKEVSTTPEPSSLLLLAPGFLGVLGARRKFIV